MNDTIDTGPCAEYEHDLVDLLEGSLGPERARVIRLHVAACPRCRAWQAEFAGLDASLASAMPRPRLSAEFEDRLRERLSAIVQPARRSELRSAEDREYERTLEVLGRGVRRHVLLDAIGTVAATLGLLVAARGLSGSTGSLLDAITGPPQLAVSGALGIAVAAAALAWSAARGVVPLPGLRR
ncbi:MAG: zf-HC2 domain-containing protein [Steroidobacteraceae bacterium]